MAVNSETRAKTGKDMLLKDQNMRNIATSLHIY